MIKVDSVSKHDDGSLKVTEVKARPNKGDRVIGYRSYFLEINPIGNDLSELDRIFSSVGEITAMYKNAFSLLKTKLGTKPTHNEIKKYLNDQFEAAVIRDSHSEYTWNALLDYVSQSTGMSDSEIIDNQCRIEIPYRNQVNVVNVIRSYPKKDTVTVSTPYGLYHCKDTMNESSPSGKDMIIDNYNKMNIVSLFRKRYFIDMQISRIVSGEELDKLNPQRIVEIDFNNIDEYSDVFFYVRVDGGPWEPFEWSLSFLDIIREDIRKSKDEYYKQVSIRFGKPNLIMDMDSYEDSIINNHYSFRFNSNVYENKYYDFIERIVRKGTNILIRDINTSDLTEHGKVRYDRFDWQWFTNLFNRTVNSRSPGLGIHGYKLGIFPDTQAYYRNRKHEDYLTKGLFVNDK